MTTNQTAAGTGYGYTVSRVVDAPVDKVWAVWTQDEHYEGVFHAQPGSVRLDVRPGGAPAETVRAGRVMTGPDPFL